MAVLEYVACTLASVRRQADRVVSPDTRTKALQGVHDFALEHPLFFSFLVVQALFAVIPVLFFASFVLAVLCLGLVSALLFSLFWIGLAVLVLGSTLFVSSAVAVLTWVWVVAVYVAASFVYGLMVSKPNGPASCPTKMPKLQEKRDYNAKKEHGSNSEDANGAETPKDRNVKAEADGHEINGCEINGNGIHHARTVDGTPTSVLGSDTPIL